MTGVSGGCHPGRVQICPTVTSHVCTSSPPPPLSASVRHTHLCPQKLLFSLGGSFLYYADHFKLYSGFCANHIKVQKVLERGRNMLHHSTMEGPPCHPPHLPGYKTINKNEPSS